VAAGHKFLYGHVRVTIAWLACHPLWGTIGLPLRALLYVRAKDAGRLTPRYGVSFRTKLPMAAELVGWAADWLRYLGKALWVEADGAYAKRPFLKAARAAGVVVVSRLRKDAAPWSVPAAPRPGAPKRRGRPPAYGKQAIGLARRTGQRRGWQSGALVLYGEAVATTYKTFLATYRPAGGLIPRSVGAERVERDVGAPLTPSNGVVLHRPAGRGEQAAKAGRPAPGALRSRRCGSGCAAPPPGVGAERRPRKPDGLLLGPLRWPARASGRAAHHRRPQGPPGRARARCPARLATALLSPLKVDAIAGPATGGLGGAHRRRRALYLLGRRGAGSGRGVFRHPAPRPPGCAPGPGAGPRQGRREAPTAGRARERPPNASDQGLRTGTRPPRAGLRGRAAASPARGPPGGVARRPAGGGPRTGRGGRPAKNHPRRSFALSWGPD
jgi:hypothetical protein